MFCRKKGPIVSKYQSQSVAVYYIPVSLLVNLYLASFREINNVIPGYFGPEIYLKHVLTEMGRYIIIFERLSWRELLKYICILQIVY